MASEKELLERVIKKKLGKGKAEYEVNVEFEGKRIDLVFEKESEIWLIEAKRQLNFVALGQVLTHKKLYEHKTLPLKNIKLGIVCEETDAEVEEACKSEEMEIFVFPEDKIGGGAEEALICGVCGSQMVEEGEEYKCKTCEYFFGMSSLVKQCEKCGVNYGAYPAVENKILGPKGKHFAKNYWIEGICPKCREDFLRKHPSEREYASCPDCGYTTPIERAKELNFICKKCEGSMKKVIESFKPSITIADLIREELELIGMPKEFIDYSLGRMKPYFGRETVAENKNICKIT